MFIKLNNDYKTLLLPSNKKMCRETPANMPRWNLCRRSQKKIEGMGVIFPQLLCYMPLCYISIVMISVSYC